jgi:serine protease Do
MPFPVPGRITDLLRRSTVQIRADSGHIQGSGSGIALNDGRIVTNAHVLIDDEPWIETWEGHTERVRIVTRDRRRDLALLAARRLSLTAVTLASRSVERGQPVIAVGNPLGFVGAVSTGTVHATGPVRGLGYSRWIQSDVRLAPGNSGGPLANIYGEIVGVNTMIAGPLALTIPANIVQAFLSSSSTPRSLGVTVRPIWVRSPAAPPRFGLILLNVDTGTAAHRASLLQGDILIAAAGKALQSPDDLYDAISGSETLSLAFLRGGSSRERRVTVQVAPVSEANAA